MSAKVIMVGLDGATYSLLNPLIREGRLPALKWITENGVSGILKSTIPPYTATAWTSFATGKNPGKHGVYDFRIKLKDSAEKVFVNSGLIKGEKIWNTLSRHGKKVGVINFPISYPPEEVNGFMISGFLSPRDGHTYSYPQGLFKEIVDEIGGYCFHVKSPKAANPVQKQIEDFVDRNLHAAELRSRTFNYLMRRHKTDFLFLLFASPDSIQHKLWKYLDRKEMGYEDKDIQAYILKCYTQIDQILERLLKNIDENTTLIVMSDHGFCSGKKVLKVNQWLWNNDFLVPNYKRLLFDDIGKISKRIGLKKRGKLIGGNAWAEHDVETIINHKRTSAYFARSSEQGIHIKRDVVRSEKEYNRLRNEIKHKLLAYRDENDGRAVLENVYFPQEIYSGPFTDEAPDLILIPAEGCSLESHFSLLNSVSLRSDKSPMGIHHPDGIFLSIGKHMKKGKTITKANIIDIAPTILYAMDVPIPKDMDGKVLFDIFSKDFVEAKPIEYAAPVVPSGEIYKPYSKEGEEEIKDKLRGLGYL